MGYRRVVFEGPSDGCIQEFGVSRFFFWPSFSRSAVFSITPRFGTWRSIWRRNPLEQSGIAFATPSTVTGQEEEKQALALTFADVLKRERPNVRCTTLAETLGAVNHAGLAEDYRRMYADYRHSGLFERDVLR